MSDVTDRDSELERLRECAEDADTRCSSMVSARDLTIRDLKTRIAAYEATLTADNGETWESECWAARRQRDELRAALACDACAGTGKPTSGTPCMCGGSGSMADAARFLRTELVRVTTERDEARARQASLAVTADRMTNAARDAIVTRQAAEREWTTWKATAERYETALTEIRSRATAPRRFAQFGADAAERYRERSACCEEIHRLATGALNEEEDKSR